MSILGAYISTWIDQYPQATLATLTASPLHLIDIITLQLEGDENASQICNFLEIERFVYIK